MPKGYVIARVTVTNPEAYAEYAKGATEAIRQYGGRPLVRGGASAFGAVLHAGALAYLWIGGGALVLSPDHSKLVRATPSVRSPVAAWGVAIGLLIVGTTIFGLARGALG